MFILLMNFPLNPNCLKFSNQSFSLSNFSFPYQTNGFSPHENIQLPPFGFKPTDLIFYIQILNCFLSATKVTKLQLELESPFEVTFSFPSLELLWFSTTIFYGLYWIFFSGVVNTMFHFSFFNFQLIVYFFVFIFTIFFLHNCVLPIKIVYV